MTDFEPYSGQILAPPRRFRWRTVLLPLAFLAIHWVAINMVASIYLIVYILLQSGMSNPLAMLGDVEQLNRLLTEHYPLISVFYSGLLIPLYMLYLYLQKRQDPRAVWLERVSGSQVFPSLAMAIGALGLINLWFNLLLYLTDYSPLLDRLMSDYMETANAFSPTQGYFWLILGISILTPAAEELLFRGILQGELHKALPDWAAVVIQAVVFAAFHWQPVQVSYVLLPGLLLGFAYAWTRSLWVPILMHMLFNFLGSVLPSLVGEDEVLGQIVGISEMAFILIGALCLIYLYRNRKTERILIQGEQP